MPRTPGIRRYIFNVLTGFSLLLTLAVVGLWVDGYWYFDNYVHTQSRSHFVVTSIYGLIELERGVFIEGKNLRQEGPGLNRSKLSDYSMDYHAARLDFDLSQYFLGFGYGSRDEDFSDIDVGWDERSICTVTRITAPHWLFLLLFVILPAVWLNKRLTGHQHGESFKRYVFLGLAILSLLLLLLTTVLWGRSYFGNDGITRMSELAKPWINFERTVSSAEGTFAFIYDRSKSSSVGPDQADDPIWSYDRTETTDSNFPLHDGPLTLWNRMGFGYVNSVDWYMTGGNRNYRSLVIPHWFLTVIFAIGPAIWLFKWNKRRKLAIVGKCPSCGYDLTGNETGLCSECGVGAQTPAESN